MVVWDKLMNDYLILGLVFIALHCFEMISLLEETFKLCFLLVDVVCFRLYSYGNHNKFFFDS